MGSDGRELTPKQAAFVAEYLVDLNATAAARRSGLIKRLNVLTITAACVLLVRRGML